MTEQLAHPYWTAYRTIVTKEFRRFIRIWVQTVLPPVITTTLYFLIFGKLMGERIGTMAGTPYMDYIVPGVILMAVINNSYANVVSSVFSAKIQKYIEELLVAPLPNSLILLGYVSGGVMRGLTVGVAVSAVSLIFTDFQLTHPLVAFGVVILTSMLFSIGGFINAIFARTFDDISLIPTFVLTPLTYLGGIFYSIELLPEFWQTASLANPILYMINAFRYGVLGVADIQPLTAFALILLFLGSLFLFALYLLNRGIGIRT